MLDGAERVISASIDTALSYGGPAAAALLLGSVSAQARSGDRRVNIEMIRSLAAASSGGPPTPPAVHRALVRVAKEGLCRADGTEELANILSREAERLDVKLKRLAARAIERLAPCGGETIVTHLAGLAMEEFVMEARMQGCLPSRIVVSGPESAESRTISREAAARRLERRIAQGATKTMRLPKVETVALADVSREIARADAVFTVVSAVSYYGSAIAPAGAEVVQQAAVMHGPGLTILTDTDDLFLDGDPVDHSVMFTYLAARPNTRYVTPGGVLSANDLVDLYVQPEPPFPDGRRSLPPRTDGAVSALPGEVAATSTS